MKKIIIGVVALCVAVAAQAATANWKASASNMYAGNATDKYTGKAYYFDAGVMSQTALFAIFEAGTEIGSSTAGYVGSGSINSGTMTATSFSYGEQSASATDTNDYTFYFAVITDDAIYFSNEKVMSANATATAKTVGFGTQNGTSTFSSLAPNGTGYQGAGYWSSVPEPTSGLLLLLGMAGLALKRKRA